jgi:hypothetical protein
MSRRPKSSPRPAGQGVGVAGTDGGTVATTAPTAPVENILRDRVPAMIAMAGDVARRHRAGVASLIDLMMEEMKLRGLVEDVVAAYSGSTSGAGLRTDEYEILDLEPERLCIASAPMAFCPEAVLMVHAPIVIGRLAALAEKLAPGQTVVGLRNITFNKPIVHDTVLVVGEAESATARYGSERPASRGSLALSDGRRLSFGVFEDQARPVTRWIDNASIARLFRARLSGAEGVDISFGLEGGREAMSPLNHAEAVQLLLEAVMRAIVLDRRTRNRAVLLSKIELIHWPEDLSSWFEAGFEFALWVRQEQDDRGQKRAWRRLAARCVEVSPAPRIEAEFKGVEGGDYLSYIFA